MANIDMEAPRATILRPRSPWVSASTARVMMLAPFPIGQANGRSSRVVALLFRTPEHDHGLEHGLSMRNCSLSEECHGGKGTGGGQNGPEQDRDARVSHAGHPGGQRAHEDGGRRDLR